MSGYAAYDAYIGSVEWADRRAQFATTHKPYCKCCSSRKRLNLHHRTYERMGAELDADLMWLCERCHKRVHDRHNLDRSQNLALVTDDVIHEYKLARAGRTATKKAKKRTPARRVKAKPKQPQARLSAEFLAARKGLRSGKLMIVATKGAKPQLVARPANTQLPKSPRERKKTSAAKRLVAIEQFKKAQGFG